MGRLVGEGFKDYVSEQINVRQQIAGSGFSGDTNRTQKELQILNNRNSWLKLGSSVRILSKAEMLKAAQIAGNIDIKDSDFENRVDGVKRLEDIGIDPTSGDFMGKGLATKSVLFNSLSELTLPTYKKEENTKIYGSYKFREGIFTEQNQIWNNSGAYGLGGNQQGFVPPPGLIDAKIEALNRGSIRKATVNIKAHNKFQFELIELLYIRLGYTMLLEWGWNKFIDNNGDYKEMSNTLMEDIFFQDFATYNFRQLISAVERYRKIYDGNYDGFVGKVSNFSWDFDQDGTYNITLNLISVGDVIESIVVNNPVDMKSVANIQAEISGSSQYNQKSPFIDSSIVTNAGSSELAHSLFTDIISLIDKKSPSKWEGNSEYINLYTVLGNETNNNKNQIKSLLSPTTELDKFGYFLTLGELLDKINSLCIPNIAEQKIIGIDTNRSDNIMSAYPNQISLDPRICFVKPKFTDNLSSTNNGDTYIKTWPTLQSRMRDWLVIDKGNPDVIYGNTMNIYINYDFVSNILEKQTKKGNIFLYKFLQEICDGINGAFGGIPNLEPIIEDDFTIVIQDQNRIRGIEGTQFSSRFDKDEETSFELFGYNLNKLIPKSNIVRKFGFQTKIDPSLSTMISIGATANGFLTKNYDATAFSNWNSGLKDQYQATYQDPQSSDLPPVEENNAAFAPFTKAQIDALNTHFDKSENFEIRDNNRSESIIKRRQDRTTIEKYGISHNFRKNVKASPLTGKDYPQVTWSEYIERLERDYISKTLKSPKPLDQFSTNYIGYLIEGFNGKVIGQPKTDGYYFKLIDDFIKVGKTSFKSYVNTLDNLIFRKTGSPSTKIGFIPLNLSLESDGISGIKIYQRLNINQDFLPSQYPKALEFIITQVNHSISDNDWSTNLNTISTPKTKAEPLGAFILDEFINNTIEDTEEFFTTTNESTIDDGKERRPIRGLHISNSGLEELKKAEGFRPRAYDDLNPNIVLTAKTAIQGTLTIGYGFTKSVFPNLNWNTVINPVEADTLLKEKILIFERTVKNNITVPLTQGEFDALVNIAYNSGVIGNTSSGKPTPLLNTLNNKQYASASKVILKYRVTSKGIPLNGLLRRREKEQALFLS